MEKKDGKKSTYCDYGGLFHLTQRGNYRQNIFSEDNDKIQYLKYFEHYRKKYGLDVFAYCLMNNHVHFIVRPSTVESMAQTICRAHQKYSLYYHSKNQKRGHLWQERYYSCLLQGDHVQRAIRYVECNPLRAGLVRCPWDYGFSSARAHLGTKYKLITLADISEYVEVSSWKEYLLQQEEDGLVDMIRKATMKGAVVGTEDYIRAMEQCLGSVFMRRKGRPNKSNK